jgi:hypothetical protein
MFVLSNERNAGESTGMTKRDKKNGIVHLPEVSQVIRDK